MNKNFIKYAAVAVAGYLVGFYEMKYKVTKVMLEGYIKKDNDLTKDSKKEEA